MFLYLFDMVEFDEKGNVCANAKLDIEHSRSNFLYLISKYNQQFLTENGEKVPEFFKSQLNEVLFDVESHGNYEKARKAVLSNCCPKVQLMAKLSSSDQDLVRKLNDKVSVADMEFACKFGKAVNNLQLQYIITNISGKVFDNICTLSTQDLSDKKNKSSFYKEIIKYNALVHTADMAKANDYAFSNKVAVSTL